MDYTLPTEFDIIIVGTGVVESIISAAASRIGKRVLHIDNNDFYGGYWASFNLKDINNLPTKIVPTTVEAQEKTGNIYSVGNPYFYVKDFKAEWHIPENIEEKDTEKFSNNLTEADNKEAVDKLIEHETAGQASKWTQNQLLKESRKFNIDLAPKLQFARGDFVELLISSNIARYSEYRSVSRVLTYLNGQLEVVPCSRSDVFSNNKVSVIEKRMLMKLFTSLDDVEKEIGESDSKTFKALLKEKKLTANLVHYVLYAIAMGNDAMTDLQGIANTKRFLNSLGRFGKTPFLFSMYGSGEITQAFCRLSAVFGGIYALSQPLNGLMFDSDNKFTKLLCREQEIFAVNLVIGVDKCPKEFITDQPKEYISRAVLITDKSIMSSEKEHLTLLLYPPLNGKNSCVIIELGHLTGTCLKDLYIVHLISRQKKTPEEDFRECLQTLFNFTLTEENKPKVLWSCYFSIPDSNNVDLKSKAPKNVHVCPGPDLDLDYDFSVRKAKEIFNEIYPDLEFLPRAPNPEDIVIEAEDGDNREVISNEVDGPLQEKNANEELSPNSTDSVDSKQDEEILN